MKSSIAGNKVHNAFIQRVFAPSPVAQVSSDYSMTQQNECHCVGVVVTDIAMMIYNNANGRPYTALLFGFIQMHVLV